MHKNTTVESFMFDVKEIRLKGRMRVEVGKEAPIQEIYNRRIFMTLSALPTKIITNKKVFFLSKKALAK